MNGLRAKNTGVPGYRTEVKKFIRFSVSKKLYLSWEVDITNLKERVKEGLEVNDDKLNIDEFQFTIVGQKTLIQLFTALFLLVLPSDTNFLAS